MKNEEDYESVSLEDRGVFFLNGDIDEDSCKDVIRWILEENYENRFEKLTLIINSLGGEVASGFAVIDIINGSKIPIRTVGIGSLMSMGLSIFIAGEKGERILTPNTLIMSHQWEGGLFGKEHELIAGVKGNQLISEMILRHYRRCTGLTINNIKKYLLKESDVFLSAKEALELGLCDEIRLF